MSAYSLGVCGRSRQMDAKTLLSRIGETMSVRRAFGEPIERDGIVMVPVAFVAGGGGGGEGPVPPATSGHHPEDAEESSAGTAIVAPPMGSGGGVGGVIIPLGVYVMKGGEVRWKPVLQPMLLALPAFALIRLVAKARARAIPSIGG
jgi:uncharacterized spore protein YtfJ